MRKTKNPTEMTTHRLEDREGALAIDLGDSTAVDDGRILD